MQGSLKRKSMLMNLILFVVLMGLDQLTKYLTLSFLKGREAIVLISGVFELRYLENRGAAFGILQGQQWFFMVVGLIFLVVATWILSRVPEEKKYRLFRLVVVMLAAGAAGNVIDRVLYHFVVDFLYFVLIDFPIFNVADCYVTVGCAVLVIMVLFVYKDEDLTFLSLKKSKSEE